MKGQSFDVRSLQHRTLFIWHIYLYTACVWVHTNIYNTCILTHQFICFSLVQHTNMYTKSHYCKRIEAFYLSSQVIWYALSLHIRFVASFDFLISVLCSLFYSQRRDGRKQLHNHWIFAYFLRIYSKSNENLKYSFIFCTFLFIVRVSVLMLFVFLIFEKQKNKNKNWSVFEFENSICDEIIVVSNKMWW